MMDLAEQILKERYYQDGEDWGKLCRRVAHAVAQGEAGKDMEEVFYSCMLDKLFLPNSPTLMNAGLPDGTLSACFTTDVDDNLPSIMNNITEGAIIGKWGGGFGANWSNVRPEGSRVGSTNGVASGVVSFLSLLNSMCDVIKQGGRRRIAVMSILDVDHPEIEKFITAKTDSNELNNMNMSVMINDEFMLKLSREDPESKEIWDLIVKTAHKTGEPGLLFYDTINYDNITPNIPIRATNPCAEEPMIPYSSCNLISIDVSKLVENGMFNWDKFKELIEICVKFADSVIDINKFPLEKIKKTTLDYRAIGCGIMGFSTCLIKMGVIYGSEESYSFASQLGKVLYKTANKTSIKLGNELGHFPKCSQSTLKEPRRNAYLCSLAPTGTISSLAGSCSFGIEPLFSVAYKRKVMDKTFDQVDPLFKEMILNEGLDYDFILEKVIGKNSIQNVECIPEKIRKLFVTAHDLTPKQHVKMLSTFQERIDTGVSKTVNMPNESTEKEVDELFWLAYQSGCKGVTIYRDGSRDAPITTDVKLIDKEFKAPDITFGATERIQVACGHFLCNVSGVNKQPLKIINNATTGCCDANLHALQRIISLALRTGISPKLITKQLDKVTCDACKDLKTPSKSCAAGMSKVLKLYDDYYSSVGEINIRPKKLIENKKTNLINCSNCKKEYETNIKCGVCPHCGFSRCL